MKFALRLALPALLAVVLVAQIRRSSDLMRAQHLLWSVERRTLVMLRTGDLDKVKLRGHLQALAEAERLDPAEIGVPTLSGSQHLMLGEVQLARQAYTAAFKLEPRPEILINLGKVRHAQGAKKQAVRYYGQAVLLDPRMLREVPEELRQTVSDTLRSQDYSDSTDED